MWSGVQVGLLQVRPSRSDVYYTVRPESYITSSRADEGTVSKVGVEGGEHRRSKSEKLRVVDLEDRGAGGWGKNDKRRIRTILGEHKFLSWVYGKERLQKRLESKGEPLLPR